MEVKLMITGKLSTRIDFDELQFGKMIGEGSFGTVFKGRWRENTVAIKVAKQTMLQMSYVREDFIREVDLMEHIRSPYIITLFGAVVTPSKMCLVTEFMRLFFLFLFFTPFSFPFFSFFFHIQSFTQLLDLLDLF